jgi:hypothetical protein
VTGFAAVVDWAAIHAGISAQSGASDRTVIHIIHRNTNDRTKIVHDLSGEWRRMNGDFYMTYEAGEDAIDEIVASCNGDIRGALKALLIVNEHLEDELQRLYAAAREGSTLH